MILLHFCFDMSEYIALRIPIRVLAAFIFLQGIFRSCSQAVHIRTWQRRLHHLRGLSLQAFSDLFQSGKTVYVMIMPLAKKRGWDYRCGALLQRKRFYVGSTCVSVHSRQDARLRKYRLLQRGEFCNAELTLHYFRSRGHVFDAIIIPLHCFTDLQQARATEYSFSHSWKPQLNAPWVVKLNPTSTTCFAQPFTVRSTYGSPGKRLWQWMKVRRRLRTLGLLHLYQNTILEPVDNWLLLINLANGGMKAFQTEKRLRSAEYHHEQVYAPYRLWNLLDDPPQTAVRSTLRRVLQFRQCAVPRSPRPPVLPLLAHQSFPRAIEQWIAGIISTAKDYMIPFHLPHKKSVAGKHRSLRGVIYNNISMAESWTWESPPYCNCSLLRQQHPHAKFIDGHLASPLSMMSFFRRLQHLLQCSMDSQLFPNLQHYLSSTWPVVDRWLRHRNVFTVDFEQWHQFVLQEWPQHKSESFHRLKYKDETFRKESLRGLFIHGRDHAITHGHVFCQRFAWETYKATFGDANVYEQLPMQPSQAEVFLRSTTSRPFLRRYKWGVNLRTSSLPIAYILLKQKKDFKAARPIISYVHFLYARLFRATAIALDLILRSACPRSFGLDTLPSILQKLTVFLQQLPGR